MPKPSIQCENDCLIVSGEMNFETVIHLWNESLPLLAVGQKFIFDFSNVSQVNSAALALLIEWKKYATQHQKVILFKNLPEKLKTIYETASSSGFDNIFSNPGIA